MEELIKKPKLPVFRLTAPAIMILQAIPTPTVTTTTTTIPTPQTAATNVSLVEGALKSLGKVTSRITDLIEALLFTPTTKCLPS